MKELRLHAVLITGFGLTVASIYGLGKMHLPERINNRSSVPFCDASNVLSMLQARVQEKGIAFIRNQQYFVREQHGLPLMLGDVELAKARWRINDPQQSHFDHKTDRRACFATFAWEVVSDGTRSGQIIYFGYSVYWEAVGQIQIEFVVTGRR